MDPKLIGDVGLVLGSLGLALQYLRAYKWFTEVAYYSVAITLTLLAMLFVGQGQFHGALGAVTFLVANWTLFGTYLGAVMAGTKAASDTAKAGVTVVPMTNSR